MSAKASLGYLSSKDGALPLGGSTSSSSLLSSKTSPAAPSSAMSVAKTLFICALFMLVGPSLIVVNNHILKTGFAYPMFLSGLGVLSTGLAARLLIFFGFDRLQRSDAIEGWLWYKRVLPVGLASAATLAFGNMVYLHLDVGFIQMLKSFTPVIMVLVSHVAGIEFATKPVILSVLIISLGTAFSCSFVPELHPLGLIIMMLSMSTEAIRLALTQFFLQQLKFGVIEGSYVLAPACALWLFSASFVWEFPTMLEKNAFVFMLNNPNLFLLSAVMGIGVNFIAYFMIQFTSSLTMKILVTVRNMLMVVVSVLFFHEKVSANQALGYLIALVGFAGYNLSKMGYFKNVNYEDVYHALPAGLRCLLPLPRREEEQEKDEEEGIVLLKNEI